MNVTEFEIPNASDVIATEEIRKREDYPDCLREFKTWCYANLTTSSGYKGVICVDFYSYAKEFTELLKKAGWATEWSLSKGFDAIPYVKIWPYFKLNQETAK